LPEIEYGIAAKPEDMPIDEGLLTQPDERSAGPYSAVVLESGAGRARVRKTPRRTIVNNETFGQEKAVSLD
jgi:hypothetical protein